MLFQAIKRVFNNFLEQNKHMFYTLTEKRTNILFSFLIGYSLFYSLASSTYTIWIYSLIVFIVYIIVQSIIRVIWTYKKILQLNKHPEIGTIVKDLDGEFWTIERIYLGDIYCLTYLNLTNKSTKLIRQHIKADMLRKWFTSV